MSNASRDCPCVLLPSIAVISGQGIDTPNTDAEEIRNHPSANGGRKKSCRNGSGAGVRWTPIVGSDI